MLQNYFKIAWRNLLKNRVTGVINILGLAIGMAVALLIGLWVQDEYQFNKNFKNHDHLGQLLLHQTFGGKTGTSWAVSLPTVPTLRNQFGDDLEAVSLASWPWKHLLTIDEKRILAQGNYVEHTFPKMFSLEMIEGNVETALTDPNSVIISESLAQTFFGDASAKGQVLQMDTESDLKVTAVFKDFPFGSSFHEMKFFTTWKLYEKTRPWVTESKDNWGNHSFQLYTQLKPNVDPADFSRKIRDIEKAHFGEGNPEYFIHPMPRWHLHSEFKEGKYVGGRIQYVYLFSIIGVFVLILACINFMNLSTARSERRAKEVGIRKSVGSLRGQLINQFLIESLLVSFIAMILSLVLISLALPWFNEIASKEMGIPWYNAAFWGGMLCFTILTGLLAGSYPAFYLSSFKPIKALKGKFQAGKWSGVPRKALVVVQFTVSISLIIGTLVVFQQIEHAKDRPIGYDRNRLIMFSDNMELYDQYQVLRTELLSTGVVEEMCHSNSPVTAIYSNQIGFEWEGKDPEYTPSFGIIACSPEYGPTIQWEIKEGRDFDKQLASDSLALIVNEAAAETIGVDNLVGTTIRQDDQDFRVVGIVKNLIMESPYTPIKPTIFRLDNEWKDTYTVRLKEGVQERDALNEIKAVYAKLSPSSPFEFEFISERYNRKFRSEERVGKLARIFAILAIFISCLGLFGLSAYVAERRTKEIGIRKVLGASVYNLWALQSRNFIILVAISCILAIPLTWYYLNGWLTDYEYRVDLGWQVFAVAGILALIVTIATVSYQSIRAALSNPAKSLKTE